MGNLRSCYNTWGIGSQYGYQSSGTSSNGACSIGFGGFNIVGGSFVGGSFVGINTITTFVLSGSCYAQFFGSYNGYFDVRQNSMLYLQSFMRHFARGLTASSHCTVDLGNVDISNTNGTSYGVTLAGRSYMRAVGLIGSGNTNPYGAAIVAGSGSAAIIDSSTTITDTTPGTNDLSIGALGLRSHAALTAAPLGTLNDAVAAGGSCSFMTRG